MRKYGCLCRVIGLCRVSYAIMGDTGVSRGASQGVVVLPMKAMGPSEGKWPGDVLQSRAPHACACKILRPTVGERGNSPKGGRHSVEALLVKCPSVQWQPDDLTIHTRKCFLGARFLGASPISPITACACMMDCVACSRTQPLWLGLAWRLPPGHAALRHRSRSHKPRT